MFLVIRLKNVGPLSTWLTTMVRCQNYLYCIDNATQECISFVSRHLGFIISFCRLIERRQILGCAIKGTDFYKCIGAILCGNIAHKKCI